MISLATKVKQSIDQLHSIIISKSTTNDGLLSGNLGLSLYYYNHYLAVKDVTSLDKAIEIIDALFIKINNNSSTLNGISFYNGTSGLGYLLTLFEKEKVIKIKLKDKLKDLDELLYKEALIQINETNRNDFLHGAMGIVHYFTLRMPDEYIKPKLRKLLNCFCKKAVIEAEGLWFRNVLVKDKDENEINFSLSHGMCGFLLVLINAHKNKIVIDNFNSILEKSISFILKFGKKTNHKNKDYMIFPSTINANDFNQTFFSKRLAWCYGDINFAYIFIVLGKFMKNSDLQKYGNLLGVESTKRKSLKQSSCEDSHLCHGTAGLAEFYKHLYDSTQIDTYKHAWEHWIDKTIHLIPSELKKGIYVDKECDFLEGLIGVNLALLSYISKSPLKWSSTILLS